MDDAALARMVQGAQLGEQTALPQLLMLFGGLSLGLMLASVFLLYVRRQRRTGPKYVGVLTPDGLRRLRDDGTLTVAKYERLRAEDCRRDEDQRKLRVGRVRPINYLSVPSGCDDMSTLGQKSVLTWPDA